MLCLIHTQILFSLLRFMKDNLILSMINLSYLHSGTHLRKVHLHLYTPPTFLYNLLLKNIISISI